MKIVHVDDWQSLRQCSPHGVILFKILKYEEMHLSN